MFIRLDGKPPYPDATPERLRRGMVALNAIISDLSSNPIPSRQLDPASTVRNPIFTMADPNTSQSFGNRFRTMMPAQLELEPQVDMQAVGWAIADNDDYAAPIIQELYQLELEGFSLHPEYVPIDHAWVEEWLIPEKEYYWDPEPTWHGIMDLDPNPLQGYAIPDYKTHFVEDDLVQEEPRILGECFFPSTINRLVDSVTDFEYDLTLNIVDEGLPRPVVP
ncbi:hypothetical protein RHGRI_011190 [Rhododendron griersonianum]|uniref:Uncharacterized protein n=1 Tax=Rhododendron griersonianum TaxID=479676 RepID=A0AAV6KKY1_9ERIC|nr:hypothetical protein RHGRI_011190 [Rhododendron griersonianum]